MQAFPTVGPQGFTSNALLAIARDQGIGRAIMGGCSPPLQLGHDALGQHLTQLDTPLVERVNTPNCPLGKNTMLVERHQRPKDLRRQLFRQDGVRGMVAREGARRYQIRRDALGAYLIRRLAKAKTFAISKS
jgi:hypothetical protein